MTETRRPPPQPVHSLARPSSRRANSPRIGTNHHVLFYKCGSFSFADYNHSLFLDIFVPAHKPHKSKLPVKIWIYGGSNEAGGISNAMYTGCYAAENVIQVNINYRQGPLGFLAVQKAGINGNFGIQDQLLALKWIKANIESFGGDPVRFSQSRLHSFFQTLMRCFRWTLGQNGSLRTISWLLQHFHYRDPE